MSLRRNEWILGLLVPALAIVLLAVLAATAEPTAAWIAFLAAVPMFAAMFAPVLVTAIVALASVLVAAVSAASSYGQQFSEAVPLLVGVIIGAGAAVLACQARLRQPRPVTRAVPRANVPEEMRDQIDPVTGLPTRAVVVRDHAQPADRPRMVALIDCDDLTAFNDRHGRETGDIFLFAVGGRTRYALADDELVARWDSDELIVVLEADTARATLELVADKVNVNPIRTDAGLLTATVSVGAAPWRAGESLDDAIAQARGALAAAQARGPASVEIHDVTDESAR